jgi:histidine ammonia-lyase
MITPGQATLHDLRAVMGGGALALDPGWRGATQASVDALMRRLSTGEALYGVNTGFGKLAGTRIAPDSWRSCSSTCCEAMPPAPAPSCRRRWCARSSR